MKNLLIGAFLLFSSLGYAQTIVKISGGVGNRWDEKLNSQTIGKGGRLGIEHFLVPKFSLGLGGSTFSFHPNPSVQVRFTSISLQGTYYFSRAKWQPFIGIETGFCQYSDQTTIDLGGGITNKQKRSKQYGSISPKLGLLYLVTNKVGLQLQINTDFVPVANISPIGFASLQAGVSYQISQ
ncbi:MAG: hypothetical protein V4714_22990 [Bacteroidota bacterium]